MWDFVHNADGSWDWLPLIVGIVVGLGVLLFVLAILYWIVDAIGFARAAYQVEAGKITNKYYRPESMHTGVGMAMNGQGNYGPVVTTSFEDEDFIVEYQGKDGRKHRIETDQAHYDALETSDQVNAYYKISKTTGNFKWTGGFEKLNEPSKGRR